MYKLVNARFKDENYLADPVGYADNAIDTIFPNDNTKYNAYSKNDDNESLTIDISLAIDQFHAEVFSANDVLVDEIWVWLVGDSVAHSSGLAVTGLSKGCFISYAPKNTRKKY